MIAAGLSAGVLFLLGFGRLSTLPLAAGCLLIGAGIGTACRHSHRHDFTAIDQIAQASRLAQVPAGWKVLVCLGMLLIVLSSVTPWTGMVLFLINTCLLFWAGKLRPRRGIALLTLPASFLLLSCIALLFSFSSVPQGLLDLPIGSGYLCLTASNQVRTALVASRAAGAVSCLYLLALSTPIGQLLVWMQKIHLPMLLIELTFLIYRYIFLLLQTYQQMHWAAASRLGFCGVRQSLLTTGKLYAALLGRSFQKASRCWEAMESRCYEGQLHFLEQPDSLGRSELLGGCLLLLLSLLSLLVERWAVL